MEETKGYRLEILTPERLFFEGQVTSLQITAKDGELSVWRGHAPMLATIPIGELTITELGKEPRKAVHSRGFLEVRPDEALLFVTACEWPEEVDAARAQAALDRAQEKLRQKQSIVEHRQTEIAITRAMARLRVKR